MKKNAKKIIMKLARATFKIICPDRSGQSLLEILVALGIGSILIIAAATIIVPSLRTNAQADKVQVSSSLGKELLENVRVFSEGDWHNISQIATSSANKYFLVSSVSPFVVATGTEGIAEDGITSGLVGYWKMDETAGTTAYDFSGSGNNGTLAGAVLPAPVSGQISGALSFNGTSSKINLGSVAVGANATITAWVKTTAGGEVPVFSNRTTGTLYFGMTSGKFFIYDNAATPSPSMVSNNAVNTNTWHHIAWVSNGATSTMYIDGVLDKSQAQTRVGSTGVSNIGWDASNITEYFPGSIDDVRVYNRALSASEVKSIYNADIYTRYFYLEDTNRDAGGSIVSGAGTNDPSTKKVNVVFGWDSGPTSTFSTYLTRFQNKIFDQTDWSGGPGQDGPATTTSNAFSTSTLMNYSTTTGSISVQL